MIRSMYSAISGLRNHQTMMDVVGNNIANVNTTGFKGSSTVFQDVLSQSLRGAGAPSGLLGGTNPAAVGLGAKVASITTNFSQGALQRTGRVTDMAIQGDGFFTVNQAGSTLYTRAGNFSVDATGRLVTQEGAFVQGWQADAQSGLVNTNAAAANVVIPVGDLVKPVSTSEVNFGGNLPSSVDPLSNAAVARPSNPLATATSITKPTIAEPSGAAVSTSAEIYDTLGNAIPLTLTFYKTTAPANATQTWGVRATIPDPSDTTKVVAIDLPDVTFDANGERSAPTGDITLPANTFSAFYQDFTQPVALKLGTSGQSDRLTGFANTNTAAILHQDGSAAGSLQSFALSQDGLIVGSYSNGRTKAIGQLTMALFSNPEGLEKVGGSNFRQTVNSGLPQYGIAGIGGRGLLSSGTTEMSNVDLAQEFTQLIVAQRGFQANSKVVSSSDELLQEIVNLKR
ncbi:MAG: flagellar basal-body rod protein FlgF [Acidimicrobiia bacterium]